MHVRKLAVDAPILAVAYEAPLGDRVAVAYGGSRAGTLALLNAATLQVRQANAILIYHCSY